MIESSSTAPETESLESHPPRKAERFVPLGDSRQKHNYVVALAGNPNTGKSTVFNNLTGLRQHTGNWPGKTVTRAEGSFSYGDDTFKLIDLPGTYSLLATSTDEEVARDFILFGRPDVTLIVVDATRLERNLNLALQVLEITDRAILCLNLIDEAQRRRITIDALRLSQILGIPVVTTSARYNRGTDLLIRKLHDVASGRYVCRPSKIGIRDERLAGAVRTLSEKLQQRFPGLPNTDWVSLRLLDGDRHVAEAVRTGSLATTGQLDSIHEPARSDSEVLMRVTLDDERDPTLQLASSLRWEVGTDFHQTLAENIYTQAASIADQVVHRADPLHENQLERKLDKVLTSRLFGFPTMFLLFALVLWITIAGANYPSRGLFYLLLDVLLPALRSGADYLRFPGWLEGFLLDGIYTATAWVVAVMLPPMAIFFPLFTLLEDFGYLPRVAFNLDSVFRRCGAHGKQSLTMCMGLGCNAAGVVSTRIIDSPRERLIAILTNNFSLCNGRWPTQIVLATIFIGATVPYYMAGAVATLAVIGVAALGFLSTFLVSWALSRTLLRGEASAFSLELPPYRPPRVLQTLYTSLIDRTLFVLWRAVIFAAPAGAVIWIISHVSIDGANMAEELVAIFQGPGMLIGLNGVIILTYIIAIPANELVLPTIVLLTLGTGVLTDPESPEDLRAILDAGGWTTLTAVCLMLFSLMHNPCSTTLYTIWRETGSVKWTAVSALLPLAMGIVLCFLVAGVWGMFV